MSGYVWYVGYGSNLSRQRFLCYIKGGTPTFGQRRNRGCHRDQSDPTGHKAVAIPHALYFALPDGETATGNWGVGGAAFVLPESGERQKTLCRMWRITEDQFEEVWDQEGRAWYDLKLTLGQDEADPIVTITNSKILPHLRPPSASYVKTIAEGLREAYSLSDPDMASYLLQTDGVTGRLDEATIVKMLT